MCVSVCTWIHTYVCCMDVCDYTHTHIIYICPCIYTCIYLQSNTFITNSTSARALSNLLPEHHAFRGHFYPAFRHLFPSHILRSLPTNISFHQTFRSLVHPTFCRRPHHIFHCHSKFIPYFAAVLHDIFRGLFHHMFRGLLHHMFRGLFHHMFRGLFLASRWRSSPNIIHPTRSNASRFTTTMPLPINLGTCPIFVVPE